MNGVRKVISSLPVWLAVLAASAPAPVSACAACFGRSDSSLAKGMNMGIFAMLGVVAVMWAAAGGFVFYLVRRSARPKSVAVTGQAAEASGCFSNNLAK